MLGQVNKTHMVVVKDIAPLAETETRADLEVGQIGVFKNGVATAIDGTTDLTAGDQFKVVFMDVDGNIVESPLYEYDLIKTKTAAVYAAGAEQLTYIGYNGTTGSITATNSDIYTIRVLRNDWSKTWGEHGFFKFAASYESDASATQAEVADALVANMAKNFEEEKLKSGVEVTRVGMINSAAVTAANGFKNTQDVTVVNGVAAVTCTTDVTYEAAGGATLVVGDYLRIGSVGGGTALTSNVYKVTAIDGVVVSLDRKVTEASGTYTAVDGTSDIEVIPSATAVAADYGLSLQSRPVKFVPGKFKYQNITFEVTLSDAFGSTLITEDTAAAKGVGTYKEVAEMEWECRNNGRDAHHLSDSYPVTENLNADSAKTYDMIVVHFENKNARRLQGYDYSFFSLVIASEDESTATVHTDLKDILNIS